MSALCRSIAVTAVVLAAPVAAQNAASHGFTAACIVKQCGSEAVALGKDDYASSLGSCAATNFGPCASKAWDCLGDAPCRSVVTCAPKVFNECKGDIWKMLTDPKEREKIMCLASCMKDGKVEPVCVAEKCGKAAVECLADETCRDVINCIPKATMSCSKPAFECLFGKDAECRDNLKCVANGVTQCGGEAVNLLTDSKIADFISCAGSKCPHPAKGDVPVAAVQGVGAAPGNVAEQLLCVAGKCGKKVLSILEGQDTKDLLKCALQGDLPSLCSSAWNCLADKACAATLKCWTKPLETCGADVRKLVTDAAERKRLEHGATCLRTCEKEHKDDFVEAALCVMGNCGQDVLDCSKDATCRDALKCLPGAVGECALPTLDAFLHQELFQNSTKCLMRGMESCGRSAVEMLRDQDIAQAVQCASQCTRPPKQEADLLVV